MSVRMTHLLCAVLLASLVVAPTYAGEPVRLAFSEKLGLTAFANTDATEEWCHSTLSISILLKDDSPLLEKGIDGVIPNLGAAFSEKCPLATTASIAAYKDSDRSLVGTPVSVRKTDNWTPSAIGRTPPTTGASATSAKPPLQCDHSAAATDYFIAACAIRGMELARQSDGLADVKSRLEVAAKTLDCAAGSLAKVSEIASRSAVQILSAGKISKLMEFNDAITTECKKLAFAALQ